MGNEGKYPRPANSSKEHFVICPRSKTPDSSSKRKKMKLNGGDLPCGESLSDFQILREIGRGAFGIVYKARSLVNEKVYVVKQIHVKSMTTKHQFQALKEVQILRKLNHRNIIQYCHSFLDEQALYIVMEYAEGGDLHKLIRHRRDINKPFSEGEIWRFAYEIISALDCIHRNNVIHRDIKSLNIFLTKDHHIKVGDLGVSKVVSVVNYNEVATVGTPQFFAPEMIKQQPHTYKVDIWAMGCVLYQLATFEMPFKGENMISLGNNICHRKAKLISTTLYSEKLAQFIDLMLRKSPDDRPELNFSLQRIPLEFRPSLLSPRRGRNTESFGGSPQGASKNGNTPQKNSSGGGGVGFDSKTSTKDSLGSSTQTLTLQKSALSDEEEKPERGGVAGSFLPNDQAKSNSEVVSPRGASGGGETSIQSERGCSSTKVFQFVSKVKVKTPSMRGATPTTGQEPLLFPSNPKDMKITQNFMKFKQFMHYPVANDSQILRMASGGSGSRKVHRNWNKHNTNTVTSNSSMNSYKLSKDGGTGVGSLPTMQQQETSSGTSGLTFSNGIPTGEVFTEDNNTSTSIQGGRPQGMGAGSVVGNAELRQTLDKMNPMDRTERDDQVPNNPVWDPISISSQGKKNLSLRKQPSFEHTNSGNSPLFSRAVTATNTARQDRGTPGSGSKIRTSIFSDLQGLSKKLLTSGLPKSATHRIGQNSNAAQGLKFEHKRVFEKHAGGRGSAASVFPGPGAPNSSAMTSTPSIVNNSSIKKGKTGTGFFQDSPLKKENSASVIHHAIASGDFDSDGTTINSGTAGKQLSLFEEYVAPSGGKSSSMKHIPINLSHKVHSAGRKLTRGDAPKSLTGHEISLMRQGSDATFNKYQRNQTLTSQRGGGAASGGPTTGSNDFRILTKVESQPGNGGMVPYARTQKTDDSLCSNPDSVIKRHEKRKTFFPTSLASVDKRVDVSLTGKTDRGTAHGLRKKRSHELGNSPASRSSVGQSRGDGSRVPASQRQTYRRVMGHSVESAKNTIDVGNGALSGDGRGRFNPDIPDLTTQLKMQRTEGSGGFFARAGSVEKSAPRRKLTINDIRQQPKGT